MTSANHTPTPTTALRTSPTLPRVAWAGIRSLLNRRSLLLSLCFLAFALRLFHLDYQSLWYDEGFSWWLSSHPLDQIIARTAADIHPPLYYLVLHFWMSAAGASEFALRYLSLMAGVLLVPAFFILARRLLNEPVAWVAALMAALSPLYIWYAQEARMYEWLVLLTVLSSYAFWRWTERATWQWWLAWTLLDVLAVYLHFYGFFVVAFQALYFFIWWVRQETRWLMLLAGLSSAALVGAAYLPWAQFAVARFGADQSFYEGTLPLGEVLRKTFALFSVGQSMLEEQAVAVALGFVLLALFGVVAIRSIRTDRLKSSDDNPFRQSLTGTTAVRWFLLLWLIVPFVLLYLVSYARPKFEPRYLMIASPPFIILVAVTVATFTMQFVNTPAHSRRHYFALPLASVVGMFVLATTLIADNNLYFDAAFGKDDFRGAARAIQAQRVSGEPTVLVSGHMFPVYEYYDRGAQEVRLPDIATLDTQRVLGYNVANDLNRALRNKRGAWVVLWQNDVVDPNGFVTTILDSQAKRIAAQEFFGVQVLHYDIPAGVTFADKPQIQHPLSVNFGNQIELLGYTLPDAPPPADQGVRVTLYWRALADLQKDYQVALRVRDGSGQFLLGSYDGRPGAYNYPTTRWKKGDLLFGKFTVPLELATPPGSEQLEVTLYTRDNTEGLDVLDAAGNARSKFIVLQPIPVERAKAQPAIEKLKIKHPLRFNFGSSIEMLGFDMDKDKAEPGDPIAITVYWRAVTPPKEDFTVAFQMQRAPDGDNPRFEFERNELVSGYATSKWRPGEIARAQYTYFLPNDLLPGDRILRLLLFDHNNKQVGAAVALGDLHVQPSTRVFRPPVPRVVDVERFGSAIQLYGYDILPLPTLRSTVQGTTTVSAGDVLRVTLYWRSLQRVSASYSVFVHLLADPARVPANAEGAGIVAQRDAVPGNGARPTPAWVPGEFISDSYELTVPRSTPVGVYVVEVGLYDSRTNERLLLQGSPPPPTAISAATLGVRVVVR